MGEITLGHAWLESYLKPPPSSCLSHFTTLPLPSRSRKWPEASFSAALLACTLSRPRSCGEIQPSSFPLPPPHHHHTTQRPLYLSTKLYDHNGNFPQSLFFIKHQYLIDACPKRFSTAILPFPPYLASSSAQQSACHLPASKQANNLKATSLNDLKRVTRL